MPDSSLIEVKYTSGSERSDIVDLDDHLFVAVIHQSKSRLIEPAVSDTTKLIAQKFIEFYENAGRESSSD